jgi:hypothetical protein
MKAAQLGAPRQSVAFGGKQAGREAERRFPVRIRITIPHEGFGNRLGQMNAWLDANCGSDGWSMTPSSTRGVVNDVLGICFADATLASAFVARWCAMQRVEIVDGVYQVRNDEPTQRIGAALHRTP